MFGKRSLRITVVKDKQPEEVRELYDYELVQTIATWTVVVVLAYMGADALRKILVHVVATKIT